MNQASQSILLVQTAFLGDIVLSTPVIAAIRKRHPDSKLSVLTTKGGKELLANDPRIDEIIVFDKRSTDSGIVGFFNFAKHLRAKSFTTVYSLHKSARTSLLLYFAGIKQRVGFSSSKLSFLYNVKKNRIADLHDVERNLCLFENVDESEKELTLFTNNPQKLLAKYKIDESPYVVVAPGSIWRTKRWSAKNFRNLVSELSKYIKVVVTGSGAEIKLCEYVCGDSSAKNLASELSLSETINIISGSKAVICNDSLPLHIASAFKRPVVALFCATSPEFGFGPWRTQFRVLESDFLSCKPCMRHGSQKCPTGTESCRTEITHQQVITTLKELAVI